MPRGRKRQELGSGWEESDDGARVRCQTCFGWDLHHDWIARSSAANHARTTSHLQAVRARENRQREVEAARVEAQQVYHEGGVVEMDAVTAEEVRMEKRPGMSGPQEDLGVWAAELGLEEDVDDEGLRTVGEEGARILEELEEWGRYLEDEDDAETVDEQDDEDADRSGDSDTSPADFESTQSAFDRRNSNWAPYTNKTMFLIDVLDNLPRLRTSRRLMEMILWVMKNIDPGDVPSWKSLRGAQEKIRKECGGIPTKKFVSSVGNILYLNDIPSLIAKDYSNPETAPLLQFYPEEHDELVSEFWHGTKLRELPKDLLTPMWRKGYKDFYVNELAALSDGGFVIPVMWIVRKGKMCCDARRVTRTEDGFVVHSEVVSVRGEEFKANFLDLVRNEELADHVQLGDFVMPNPLRALAGGEELFSSFLHAWADDVSGNKTKMINAHMNLYGSHANLPGRLLQQEYFVRFFSTSPYAGSPEQFEAVKGMVDETQRKPVQTMNAATQRMCKFRIIPVGLPADNPQQSDEASHIGMKGNCGCRKCMVGGSGEHKSSSEGFEALHHPGVPRTKEDTVCEIESQLQMALGGDITEMRKMQTASGVKDSVMEQWVTLITTKRNAIMRAHPRTPPMDITREVTAWLHGQCNEPWSPLLKMRGLDPHTDTPVEILHTILLGVAKYVWYGFHVDINDTKRATFVTRLQSTDTRGLTGPPIRASYMTQYRNALIGKHYKTIMQTLVFHVHDLVNDPLFKLIRAVGALGALLWIHDIEDLEVYLHDLQIVIDNVIDAFDAVDGQRLLAKPKIHLLVHLVDDIRRFGPAIRFATEIFECFNAIFRLCSILSNHQSPSHDISCKMASMERVKHLLSGGFWEQGGTWVQAGAGVRALIHKTPKLQDNLGWAPERKYSAGSYDVAPTARRKELTWAAVLQTMPTGAVMSPGAAISPQSLWGDVDSLTSGAGDPCDAGTWIFYTSPLEPTQTLTGRLASIWAPRVAGREAVVLVQHFPLRESLHPFYQMPVLAATTPERTIHAVHPRDVLFHVNVQHDCRLGGCQATGTTFQRQEREKTSRTTAVIEHCDDDTFILNTHSIHHADLLRRVLPRALTLPRRLYELDCRAEFHQKVAGVLRETLADKKAKRKEKAAATRAANKKRKAGGGAAADPPADPPATLGPTRKAKRRTDDWSGTDDADDTDSAVDEDLSEGDPDVDQPPLPIRRQGAGRQIKKPRLWVPGD